MNEILIDIYNSDDIKKTIKNNYNMSLFDFTKHIIYNTDNCDYFLILCNIYKKLYTNINTLDSILSKKIRKHVADKYGINSKEHMLSKQIIKITNDEKNLLIHIAKDNLANNNKHLQTYKLSDILYYIERNLDNGDPFKVLIVLLIISGSRPFEIFNSTFEIVNLFYIKQNFVAKSKNKEKYIIKPIIYLTSKEFIGVLEKTKNKININNQFIDSNGEILSTYKNKLRYAMADIFNNKLIPYTARKLYANLSYHLYSNNNCSFNYWVSSVLGHDNIYTSIHYVNLNIEYDIPYKNILDQNLDFDLKVFLKETKNYATKKELLEYYNKNNLFFTHFS